MVYAVRSVGDKLAVKDVFDVCLDLPNRIDGVLELVVGQLAAKLLFNLFLELVRV